MRLIGTPRKNKKTKNIEIHIVFFSEIGMDFKSYAPSQF